MSSLSTGLLFGLLCVSLTLATRYFDPYESASPKQLSEIYEGHRRFACSLDNTNYYNHGEVFQISEEARCVTYICDRGTVYLHSEGCLNDDIGRCVHVRDTFVKIRFECHHFMCTKSLEEGYYVYQTNRVKVECYDPLARECRSETEVFQGVDANGEIRPGCTCQISQNSTKIACPNWQS